MVPTHTKFLKFIPDPLWQLYALSQGNLRKQRATASQQQQGLISTWISYWKWFQKRDDMWDLFMKMDGKKIFKQTDNYLFCKYHGRYGAAVFWWPCLSFGLSCLVWPEPSQTAEPAWSGPPHWAHPSPGPSALGQHHTDDNSHRAGPIYMRTGCKTKVYQYQCGHLKTNSEINKPHLQKRIKSNIKCPCFMYKYGLL